MKAIMESMERLRRSEDKVARDFDTALDGRNRSGRPITEILHEARQHNSNVTLDEEFGRDLEEIVALHQQPWIPPAWD